jgi:hypothetical protein
LRRTRQHGYCDANPVGCPMGAGGHACSHPPAEGCTVGFPVANSCSGVAGEDRAERRAAHLAALDFPAAMLAGDRATTERRVGQAQTNCARGGRPLHSPQRFVSRHAVTTSRCTIAAAPGAAPPSPGRGDDHGGRSLFQWCTCWIRRHRCSRGGSSSSSLTLPLA